MGRFCFAGKGWEDYIYWQMHDRKVLQKINSLLKSIDRDGAMEGIGKPEKLKHEKDEYSRRIDNENRIVYSVSKDTITILSCKGHYED